jgi:acyl dehydratase
MIVINSHQEFEAYLGKELGVSGWHAVTQEQINQFADATLDHQWIHTDPERAAIESPFKKTIAHGYLTLSLLPFLWEQIADIKKLKMQINYGIENLRFAQPVLSGDEVRLKTKLTGIVNLRGVSKAVIGVELEIKDQKKPAYSGDVVFLYHFIG